MPVILTRDNLADNLKTQILRLQQHAKAFDERKMFTTYDMATVIRVLFHDTRHSYSLLKQICDKDGVSKNTFTMYSSRTPEKPGTFVILGDGLYSLKFMAQGIECCPYLQGSTFTEMEFDKWWNENVIKDVSGGQHAIEWMTRKRLILGHANEEGGAHVDSEVEDDIAQMNTQEAFGWRHTYTDAKGNETETSPIVDQKQATIRQICYETLYSLHQHFPECFEEQYF